MNMRFKKKIYPVLSFTVISKTYILPLVTVEM
jgi:hypothetical protein